MASCAVSQTYRSGASPGLMVTTSVCLSILCRLMRYLSPW